MKTYGICLSNDSAIFDSASEFETVEAAIAWGLGRGGNYVMQVSADGAEESGVSLAVSDNNISVYEPWGWREMSAQEAADYVRQMVA